MNLRPVEGFEHTGYAWQGGDLVWARAGGEVDHPRHLHRRWQPASRVVDASRVARAARALIEGMSAQSPGLLPWLAQRGPLPFPLHAAQAKFDAVRAALAADDVHAFAARAPALLGLGPGLTPSGDDFIGGAMFALALVPRSCWAPKMRSLRATIGAAARQATNPISAALLADLMAGAAYRPLHEWLDALDSGDVRSARCAFAAVLALGASSGADIASGLLLALATHSTTA